MINSTQRIPLEWLWNIPSKKAIYNGEMDGGDIFCMLVATIRQKIATFLKKIATFLKKEERFIFKMVEKEKPLISYHLFDKKPAVDFFVIIGLLFYHNTNGLAQTRSACGINC